MALHILVPLDNSAYCAAASAVAMQIASSQPAQVTALRVVNVRPRSGNILEDLAGSMGFEPAVVPAEVAQERDNEATALVVDWAQAARARGIEANGVVEVGAVAQTILDHAERADLVVMGLRGETEERFPRQGGQMACWLTSRVDTPVLWVAPGISSLTSVVVGYDGSDGADHAIRAIRRFIVPLQIPIHAVYISSDGSGREVLEGLSDELPGSDLHLHVVSGESPHEALISLAKRMSSELVVLGFAGPNTLTNALFGSTTEHILLESESAVLVVR